MGGIRNRWEEVRGRECRRKEEVPGSQSPMSRLTTPNHTKGGEWEEEIGGGKRM